MPQSRLSELAARAAQRAGPLRWVGLRGSARAIAIARLLEAHPGVPALVLTVGAKASDAMLEDLRTALGEPPPEAGGRVRAFPPPDTAPYDRFSPQPFVVAQRMDVLHRLAAADGPPPVIVAPWTALAARVPSPEAVLRASLRVVRGEEIDRDGLVASLVAEGYTRQSLVEERGEVAVRGGVVDFFPPHATRPVRLELDGERVDSLREFDPASQRSQRELERVVAPPPREILFTRALAIERGEALRALARRERVPTRDVDALIDALLRGSLPPGAEALTPLLQPALASFLAFLPERALVLVDEPENGIERLLRFAGEVIENHDGARQAGRLVCAPPEVFLGADELQAAIAERRPISLERLELASAGSETVKAFGHEALAAELRAARGEARPLARLASALTGFAEEGMRAVIACPALSGAERTRALLAEYGLAASLAREAAPHPEWSAPGALEVRVAQLSEGFVLADERLVALTEEECFGPREKRRSAPGPADGLGLDSLGQLAPGDYLVHAEHGIGVYRGLVMLEIGRLRDEFLRIEYEGADRLFVPVHRLNLVQRYVGSEGAPPPVDRLGGASWQKTKSGVRRKLRDMARELIAVHAARELAPGFAFPPRDRALEEFEARFPYEETADQASAIEDALADLARPRPMDRLVCGDVGYGKTEVAARAAHQAVMAGKQVAVLVPTTVLCQQHLETFSARFSGLPVAIEALSRFSGPKQARATLEGLASGRVDVVIGTHRLLQSGVVFHDLGLLVVDEEHRFGVAHKERIKQLKQSVDVLTLTATPIPRTLQLAFSGLRDMSVIATPPPNRIAIRTQVCRFDELLVREAILREVRRGGQVFFVHNRVQTIGSLAELLARIVPEVKVLVAHGQMPERELEARMLAFFHGQADVLLSTTIVESGLDVPRANTILIDRADALGLAQLYQLRGRVGRSHQRAYAYLLIPGEAALATEAKRRLEAIQDLAALGSGFRLANMDLEIRGAGNLLGAEQSGSLGAVGYETYMELLEEAVEELRGKTREPEVDPEIRLGVPARLPESFVPEVSQRLVLYKRLASAPDDAEVDRLRDELLDRFGPLPAEALNLLEVIRLKVAARALGIALIALEGDELVLAAAASSRVDPARLHRLVTARSTDLRVLPDQRIRARAPEREPTALFARAQRVLAELRGAA